MTKQKKICRQRKELVVARGERVGRENKNKQKKQMKESKKYKSLVIKCHRDAMHSTRNYSQYFIITLYSLGAVKISNHYAQC